VLVAEIGEIGQQRIDMAIAGVGGDGLVHEIAATYARGAGFARVEAGVIDVDALAPASVVKHAAARDVLAGSRAALAITLAAARGGAPAT
jgi:hypothetical protein